MSRKTGSENNKCTQFFNYFFPTRQTQINHCVVETYFSAFPSKITRIQIFAQIKLLKSRNCEGGREDGARHIEKDKYHVMKTEQNIFLREQDVLVFT